MQLFICGIFYYLIGYALAYGNGSPYLGLTTWAGIGLLESSLAFWFFQFVFAATAATIISGAVAERCNFTAYIIYSATISGFVYPVVSHWTWHDEGWLKIKGYKDFAGSGVVHALAGVCSFVAASFMGPRIGRFSHGKTYDIPGHSLPMVGTGALLLISGFLAFNGGSLGHVTQPGDSMIIARSMLSTIIGGSGAATVALIFGRCHLINESDWPFSFVLNATLAGMVSVCGGPEAYSTWIALVVGGIGCLCYQCIHKVVLLLKVDDPLDAVAVHFGAGCWGVIARPIFSKDGLIFGFTHDSSVQLLNNFVGLFAIISWSAITSCILFGSLKLCGKLRVSEQEEIKGLDVSKHGEESYPKSAWWTNESPLNQNENASGSYSVRLKEYDNHAFQMERKNHHKS
ncbi:putative ammonium transporter 1 isoform X2 [Cimex lectularius]|uniref:Ammonium transporter AmtB-like domain-containing protein n=1 Tax=Cimex lectularius TaxID=79782 RepID=A0A8I6SEB8_CIMLE|nr:putative ammonium transporter 1 isoform X2 [Cimex lectularius]